MRICSIALRRYAARSGLRWAWRNKVANSLMPSLGGAGVLEVVEDWQSDTFRCVYSVKFAGAVYVLHTFQKKSKIGSKTPKPEIDLVKERLKRAEEHYREWSTKQKKEI